MSLLRVLSSVALLPAALLAPVSAQDACLWFDRLTEVREALQAFVAGAP